MSITDSLKKILSQLQNQEKDILFKIWKKTAEQEYTVYLSETPYSEENAPVISYDARPVDWDYHSGASGSLENQPNIYTEEDSTEFLGNKPQAACYPNKQFACENTDSKYNYSYLEK